MHEGRTKAAVSQAAAGRPSRGWRAAALTNKTGDEAGTI